MTWVLFVAALAASAFVLLVILPWIRRLFYWFERWYDRYLDWVEKR